MKTLLFGLLTAASLAGAAPVAGAASGGGEILWDSFGVPHVYAKTEGGMFYGFGYAQAQAHGNLLLHIYGESRAKAAEYWGPKFEASDRWLISNGQPKRSVEWYNAQTPQFRADLDAFAAGINAYVAAHRDKLDPEVLKVGRITGLDVIGPCASGDDLSLHRLAAAGDRQRGRGRRGGI